MIQAGVPELIPATEEEWRANGGGGFQSRSHGTGSSIRKEKQPALCETDKK